MTTDPYVTTTFFQALALNSPLCSLLHDSGGMTERMYRRHQRHLQPLAMAVLAQVAPAAALPAIHLPESRSSVAAAALHRPR